MQFDYFAAPSSETVHGLFTATRLKEMLDRKDYSNMDMRVVFMVVFLNRALNDVHNPQLTSVYTLYSNGVSLVM